MGAAAGGKPGGTAARRGLVGRLSALEVHPGEFLLGVALVPVGAALLAASTPDRWWLGSIAYVTWLLAAILIVYQTHHLARAFGRRLWTRVALYGDLAGLYFLRIAALGCTGFLASAPGRAAALAHEGQSQPLGALAWSAFSGTAIGLFLVAPRHRDQAFQKMRTIGWLAPIYITGCFLICAVTLFTAVTLLSHVHFDDVPEVGRLSAGQVASSYLWHFVDLMPLNDLPGTLRWREPLAFRGTDVGRLVVAFQLLTVVEIIATFRAYWTFRTKPREPPAKPKRKRKSKLAATTRPDRDRPDASTTCAQRDPDPRGQRDRRY